MITATHSSTSYFICTCMIMSVVGLISSTTAVVVVIVLFFVDVVMVTVNGRDWMFDVYRRRIVVWVEVRVWFKQERCVV